MANTQPRQYINRHGRLRHLPIGPERRFDRIMTIMDKSTVLPKAVMYEDIDQAVLDWVEKDLSISYNGKELPTYKLFSNQRISEYGQTWQYTDDEGNVSMNFKTITRDNNPQMGNNQGGLSNVPGKRLYTLFKVPVKDDSGDEILEIYSMRQPMSIDMVYTLVLVCDKYKLLNDMNIKVNDSFKSLEHYIYPNGHPMPLLLEAIEDESVYTINDRKYYSQAYKIKALGYIIKPEDFEVTRVPSRFKVSLGGSSRKEEKTKFVGCDIPVEKSDDYNTCVLPIDIDKKPTPIVSVVDGDAPCYVEENHYYYKSVNLNVTFDGCPENDVTFEMEINFGITNVVLNNIHDFKIKVNDEDYNIEDIDDPRFNKGEIIKVLMTKVDEFKPSKITFEGFDYDVILDDRTVTELPQDDVERHAEIDV